MGGKKWDYSNSIIDKIYFKKKYIISASYTVSNTFFSLHSCKSGPSFFFFSFAYELFY